MAKSTGKPYLVVRGDEILHQTKHIEGARAFQNALGWRGVKVLKAKVIFDRPYKIEK